VSSTDKLYMQIDQSTHRSVFHGAAASLLMRAKDIRDKLPASYEELWAVHDSYASWLEVPDLESSFVCIWGPERDELMRGFKGVMEGKLVEDLIAETHDLPHNDLLYRFYWVAYMTERPSKAVLDFFDTGMQDERENIRLSALNAYNIHRWPEWRSSLEKAAKSDTSEKVRAQAQALLDKR
jgi:hypothetical protein